MKTAVKLLCGMLFILSCKKPDSPVSNPLKGSRPFWTEDTSGVTYYEQFDSVDLAKWGYQEYTFDGNGCNLRKANVTIRDSKLLLRVEINEEPALPKKYNSGELEDRRFHLFGYFSVRMSSPINRGAVSAFFLMNKWQPENWEHKEIDIEFLGKDRKAIQCTNHDFQDGGKTWKSSSKTLPLDFDIGEGFHEYSILWTPDSVIWYVDNKKIHSDTMYVPQVPLQIRMNYYVGDVNWPGMKEWLGEVDEYSLPNKVEFDWIKVETLEEYRRKRK